MKWLGAGVVVVGAVMLLLLEFLVGNLLKSAKINTRICMYSHVGFYMG